MFQVKCDDYTLYDPRDEDLTILDPQISLAVNSVCGGSFVILPNHPFYAKLKRLKSVFSVTQDGQTIFRGRMTADSRAFDSRLVVDLEGVLAYTNDSLIPPFDFPRDFQIPEEENVVAVLLGWFLDQHNAQVDPFQRLKLGTVTVTDPNNFIERSSEKWLKTWDALEDKLFGSSLGGFLCIRYEEDGNYLDYLESFPLTNTQRITLDSNVLDILTESDSSTVFSAIMPQGAEIELEDGGSYRITIEDLPDGIITGDIIKQGLFIYSNSAVEAYGWICAPIDAATWDDVTEAQNLQRKAVERLTGEGVMLDNTITITAADLHLSDAEIQAFRVFRNVVADIPSHGLSGSYPLTELTIPLLSPQDTQITIGSTKKSLTSINQQQIDGAMQRVESAEKDIAGARHDITETKNSMIVQQTQIMNDFERILATALQSYVETGSFSEFRRTVESQLQLTAAQLDLRFSEAVQQIESVNGDLQEKFNTVTKYFSFDVNGLTIGQVDNPNRVVIDNDEIVIMVNGNAVQRFSADGRAVVPELQITRLLNLFGLIMSEDSTNINCGYIGGVE